MTEFTTSTDNVTSKKIFGSAIFWKKFRKKIFFDPTFLVVNSCNLVQKQSLPVVAKSVWVDVANKIATLKFCVRVKIFSF